MALATRLLSIIALLSLGGFTFLYDYIDLSGCSGNACAGPVTAAILALLFATFMALATGVVAISSALAVHQWGWAIGLVAATLVGVVGPFVTGGFSQSAAVPLAVLLLMLVPLAALLHSYGLRERKPPLL
jgi:hypothetical protein